MQLKLFKSKIHRATITDADLHYEGSCSIDPLLMREAKILENESIWIWNINNGERLMTYAIPGKPRQIGLNGSAARLGHAGDLVIISTFADMEETVAKEFKPTVVLVNNKNEIVSINRKSGALINTIDSIKLDLKNTLLPNGFTATEAVVENNYLVTAKVNNGIHLKYTFNVKTGVMIAGANAFVSVGGVKFLQEDLDALAFIVREKYEQTFLESGLE